MSDQNNYLELIKNINLTNIVQLIQEYACMGRSIYTKNKKTVDLCLCFFCYSMIILGWLDLSLILNIYFLGVIYMTVTTFGSFCNNLCVQEITNFERNSKEQDYVERSIEKMDDEQCRKILTNFSKLCNDWLLYASLVLCEWVFQAMNYLIGGGFIFGSLLQIMRFLLYIQYCKRFIKSLESYNDIIYTTKIYISDELADNILLSTAVKHLINVIAINNVFCYNLLAKTNLRVLILIDSCSSSGFNLLSDITLECLKQASKAKSLSSTAIENTKEYIYPSYQKYKIYLLQQKNNMFQQNIVTKKKSN